MAFANMRRHNRSVTQPRSNSFHVQELPAELRVSHTAPILSSCWTRVACVRRRKKTPPNRTGFEQRPPRIVAASLRCAPVRRSCRGLWPWLALRVSCVLPPHAGIIIMHRVLRARALPKDSAPPMKTSQGSGGGHGSGSRIWQQHCVLSHPLLSPSPSPRLRCCRSRLHCTACVFFLSLSLIHI